MGFWHTGYIEFHEETGLGGHYVPSPPVYRCAQCAATFASVDELRQHRFASHPTRRPMLTIAGTELGALPFAVTQPLSPGDIAVEHAARASLNGVDISIKALAGRLSGLKDDVARIRLHGNGISADYEISFKIADESDIVGVETALAALARGAALDARAIEQFIDQSRPFSTGMGYCQGICEYLYGVLAKDGRAELSTAPPYSERFNSAVNELALFDRPVSRTICALIEFHFNHFNEATAFAPETRVGTAAERFSAWLYETHLPQADGRRTFKNLALERLFTDEHTEQIIAWSVQSFDRISAGTRDIEALAKTELADYDSAKLRVLLAEERRAAGDLTKARQLARQLVNRSGFEKWAEMILRSEAVS